MVRFKNFVFKIIIYYRREYPVSGGLEQNIHRPEDKENYVLILKELREQLDILGNKNGKRYLLTVA